MNWFKPGGKKPKRSKAPSSAPVSSAADTGHADGAADPFAALAGRPVPAALADLFLTLEEHLNELDLEDLRTLTDVQKTAYMRIWRGSHIASTTAHAYAKHLGLASPSIYATRALLVNVGDLALISARPELAVIYAPKTSLLYLACRVGDAVAYRELKDARDYDVLADESADVFYLPAYLRKLGLESLLDVTREGKYTRHLAGS